MDIKNKIRHIPDFPREGIDFIDITPLLLDGGAFKDVTDAFAEELSGIDFDCIASLEARGFILGSSVAYALKKGFIPIRKKGKLPYDKISVRYDLEYGYDILEMHSDAVKPGDRVVIVDDLIATGGTLEAAVKLIEKLGGKMVKAMFLIELEKLNAREKFKEYDIFSAEKI